MLTKASDVIYVCDEETIDDIRERYIGQAFNPFTMCYIHSELLLYLCRIQCTLEVLHVEDDRRRQLRSNDHGEYTGTERTQGRIRGLL